VGLRPPAAGGGGVLERDGTPLASPWNLITVTAADLVGLGLDYGLRPTADKTGAYTAQIGDYVVCDSTAGAFTVTLPGGSSVVWARVGVYNRAGANLVTVASQAPDVFDAAGGPTTKTLVGGQWAIYKYDPSRSVWVVEQQGLSKQAMDALYAAIGAGGGGSGWSQVPDGLMGIGHPAIPDNVGMAWTVALEPKGLRVKCNKTGTLSSLYVNVGTSNGNWIGGVMDTGQTTNGTRTRLWKGVSVASAAGWLPLGNPGLAVTAGQWYDFVANNDGTTATLKQFANNGLSSKLPNDLWPDTPGGAQARLAFKYATQGTLDLPATVVDSSVTPNGKVPGIFGLVT
jgi:hypothetical protein